MRSGKALSDEDRVEWLALLRKLIEDLDISEQCAVIACSALEDRYRRNLAVTSAVEFMCLAADPEVTRQRLQSRTDHYMGHELLQSQFDALEVPAGVLTIENTETPETIVATIVRSPGLRPR